VRGILGEGSQVEAQHALDASVAGDEFGGEERDLHA
jgi:hypothetical protein